MSSTRTRFQLCGMLLFATVLILPHTGINQNKVNRTAPEANGRPIMTVDGSDPVPKAPVPPKPTKPISAIAA